MSIPSKQTPSSKQTPLTVALLGNPNTGKSTLFGALVGVHQHVGNYPGVTVEEKTGRMDHGGRRFELIDLPGLYSLAPRSRDEAVAVDLLVGKYEDSAPVDAIICIVDGCNLHRNLYLVNQVLDFGLPTVVAVNMLDVAEKRGIAVDIALLSQRLNVPVVAIQANRRKGLDQLKSALSEALAASACQEPTPFPEAFENEVSRLEAALEGGSPVSAEQLSRCLIRRLLLDTNGSLEESLSQDGEKDGDRLFGSRLREARDRLDKADCAVPAVETKTRYAWAERVLDGVVTEPNHYDPTTTDRIDSLLTHRLWGTLVFALVMVTVFQAIFRGAQPLMEWIDVAMGTLGGLVETRMAEGALRSLLVDGVIGGVGGVLAFLPQILILFFFIAVLEDCGYMARAAFLMDRMMVRVGLSGKSFIPMLSSFACAIPGIMAARVIENERDRQDI